ncbi:MAG: hypothetical protein JXR96_14350 [Deltaproteobacteria bacterium]|nr:hypothetical protein [Deltaproteobacteria bacterium]
MNRRYTAVSCSSVLLLALCPPAAGKARLTHSVSACSVTDRPSIQERRVAKQLRECGQDIPCRKRALQALTLPLRRCYFNPSRSEASRDKCLAHARNQAFVEAEVRDGKIVIQQRLHTYCNASDKLSLRLVQRGSALKLLEIFRARKVARCVCPLDISATIDGLPKGAYSLEIVFDNRYAKERERVHKIELKVP